MEDIVLFIILNICLGDTDGLCCDLVWWCYSTAGETDNLWWGDYYFWTILCVYWTIMGFWMICDCECWPEGWVYLVGCKTLSEGGIVSFW